MVFKAFYAQRLDVCSCSLDELFTNWIEMLWLAENLATVLVHCMSFCGLGTAAVRFDLVVCLLLML